MRLPKILVLSTDLARSRSQGEVGREMFVIVKGKVHVTKERASLGLLPAGSFFGEMAIVQASVNLSAYRDRTAVSHTHCELSTLISPPP